ncbi:FkbM family methyltransferase [Candidatus Berkelbacteria bacterium]|nr:FkbM family methyltransferase [Candidatus Berkelbacteria bacterium]
MAKFSYKNKKLEFTETIPDKVIAVIKSGRFYELRMLEFISSLNFKGCVADVGANIGNHSVYFALFTNAKKIFSFEPVPQIYKALEENIRLNKLEGKIIPRNCAIGEKKGQCSVAYEPHKKGGVAKVKSLRGSVPMDTLDNLIGSEKIGLIKIDVEGFEPQVLRGAKKILAEQDPYIFAEAQGKKEKDEIEKILFPLGYRCVKVFNATATYLYTKNGAKNTFLDDVKLYLQRFRIFRLP